ncbi:MAG: polyribonucleotide nucleotidyltransferase [Candidatus Wildermuthbacteria bacterium]|nr:polyribonucleotide nucleotidyltransferase [Candidatus Wildermuthbacteria bacterium]
MADQNFSITLGTKEIRFELNNWAEQANGSVLVKSGQTAVLVTAVMSKGESQNQGFFPLTVEYEERFYAAGKILGSRFVRREGRPTDEAIIAARVIDRAIRPLFPSFMRREVQVIATCLAWDGENDPDVLGLLGASVALTLSNIPWAGPLGALRVGKVEGNYVLNPTYEERAKSDIDFTVAAAKGNGGIALNMIEASGEEASESVFEEALKFAEPALQALIDFQENLPQTVKQPKAEIKTPEISEEAKKHVREFFGDKLRDSLFQGSKYHRMEAVNALKKEMIEHIAGSMPEHIKSADDFFEQEIDRLVHEAAIKQGKRVDDRVLDETRELGANVGILERTHGSALFTRGQTKTLSIATLGAPGDQKILEGMEFIGKKRFMHHYNFPPYSSGEVKPMRGPGRREIGHGMLAEKALLPVVPSFDEFPYAIRVVTEVVSSNGSTSMASACSTSLALMDAGVPLKRPVAGISMGLMSNEQGEYAILTDIQGPEDHHGDMDFKVAGTAQGVTAIQMDVKVRGITLQMFKEALEKARQTRIKILEEVIAKTLPEPRAEISKWAPKIQMMRINPEKIGMVIGGGGKTINKIISDCGVAIDIEEDGTVYVSSENTEHIEKAMKIIEGIVREAQVGDQYVGKVRRIMPFGAFVELWPGQEGMVHISKLSSRRIEKVTDVVNIGDTVPVKVIEIDDQGRVNLALNVAGEKEEKSSHKKHHGG